MFDPADFFVDVVADLDERTLVEQGEEWFKNDDFHDEVAVTAEDVLAGIAPRPFRWTPATPAGQRERLVTLRGIDQALAALNPYHAGGEPPPALATVAARYVAFGRLNAQPQAGILVPKLAWLPGQRGDQPLTLAQAFRSVAFVAPQELGRISSVVAPLRCGFSRQARRSGLIIACAPACEDFGELRMTITQGRHDTYAGELTDTAAIRKRLAAILAAAADGGANALILPEKTCSASLRDFWPAQLRALPEGHRLRVLFTGTGDLRPNGRKFENAGALLDAHTGEEITVQRKQFPFDISPARQAQEYPLPFAEGRELREEIRLGYECQVVELGAARVAILICENPGEVLPQLSVLTTIGVSHVVAPVFSTPLVPPKWAQTAGTDWASATGATTIVANSLLVGRLDGPAATPGPGPGKLHCAAVTAPRGIAAQRAGAPDTVLRFRLRESRRPDALDDPDGTASLVP